MPLGTNIATPHGSHWLILNIILECGHAACQIKGNEDYNIMLANILHLHTPLTHWWDKKSCFSLF